MTVPLPRRLHVGGELAADGAHFRVWAPPRHAVEVIIEGGAAAGVHPLARGNEGYFEGFVAGAAAGDRYRYRLDGQSPVPDPVSRFQPDGPHGASELVDPSGFRWTDQQWHGPDPETAVLYEMHVGTFTTAGTWRAAAEHLPYLAGLGITIIELMPIAEFGGDFGWGYDGVDLFAPYHHYGRPDELRAFVDQAHRLGIGVVLDVVYNHIGPDGNFLGRFSDGYVGGRRSEWGDAPNYDGEQCAAVRALVESNAEYWIAEYHFDGLRLDATQQIFDDSPEHIVRAIVRRAHAGASGRRLLICAENEPQQVAMLAPQSDGGGGCDALWNDDFHHSARVAATGRREAYYSDFLGSPQELLSALKFGFLFQGQRCGWQEQPRGSATVGLSPRRFVHFLENHDQVANSLHGRHLHQLTSPARLRALTALLLLGPQIPLILQGQEFAASARFCYFAGHRGELASAVRDGRRAFLAQFPSIATAERTEVADDPTDPALFAACRLDHSERERPGHAQWLALFGDLLQYRRSDRTIADCHRHGVDGAVLGDATFVLRLFAEHSADDRLLLVNLGADLRRDGIAEPLLAPPAGRQWRLRWSSESPRYGGSGTMPIDPGRGWHLSAESAALLVAEPVATAPLSLVGYRIGPAGA